MLCQCGCGLSAPIAKHTDRKHGAVKGRPQRFIQGHNLLGMPINVEFVRERGLAWKDRKYSMSEPRQAAEPLREKRFSFSHVDRAGRTLEGVFFYRRPSLRDLLRIEAEKARLCEGQALEREFLILASMMARLRVVLREVPKWLKWDELEDLTVVTRLSEEVDRIEGDWFRRDDAGGGGEGAGARAGADADRAVPAPPVVGPEVQSAADE